VALSIAPVGIYVKRLYARPNEMIRVKVAREKLKKVAGAIEVNIRER
jgi:hypothetical protein